MVCGLARVSRSFVATTLAVIAWTVIAAPLDPARAAWPERQINLIVCFPAGGGADIAARLGNTQLGEAHRTPVIIENPGGAGGNIGNMAANGACPASYHLPH